MKTLLTCIGIIGWLLPLNAQVLNSGEGAYIRAGNKAFEAGNYTDSETQYKKALETNQQSLKGAFNLGDALYGQQKFEEAAGQFETAARMADDRGLKAEAFHNMGNSFMQLQQYDKSVDAYKNALKNNPNDADTKYNLAYALQKLKQQQQENKDKNQDENKDDKDQDKKDQEKQDQENKDKQDQDKKDQEKQDQEKQDQEKEDQNQQDQQQGDQEENKDQQQGQQQQMSQEEIEQLLEALRYQEEKLQQELQKKKAKGVKVKVEKDW